MKNILLSVVVLISSLVLFSSCSKDDDKNDILVGTCWYGTNANNTKRVLYFSAYGRCVDSRYLKTDGGSIDYEVSYSVKGNDVTITEATGVYAKGSFSNNVMTITFTSSNDTWTLSKGK